ncbi:MAG TPA: hypothetical protein VJQ52_00570 [Steroidobacteraceae bacterium]|nr:hypothetical protein [Steroidobacteraceae bacterium]
MVIAALVIVATACGLTSAAACARDASSAHVAVHVERMPLAQALSVLARAANVTLSIRGAVPELEADGVFAGSGFREALQRMLMSESYVLVEQGASFELIFLSPARSDQRTLREVGTVRAEPASTAEERAAALDALVYRAANDSPEMVIAAHAVSSALFDSDERVRHQALTTLKDTADQIPIDALSRLALEDVSADVRVHALELLTERATDRASAALQAALVDSDALVRERARALIEEWHVSL